MFSFTWVVVFFLPLVSTESSYIHRFHVKENTPPGVLLGQLIVQHHMTFTSLATKPLSEYISVHPTNGSILITQTIDRETICQSEGAADVPLVLQHLDGPSCEVAFLVYITTSEESLLETVYLTVVDVNDNQPFFEPPSITLAIPESSPIGGLFYLPPAKDADLGRNGINSYCLSRIHHDASTRACPPYAATEDGYFTLALTDDNAPQMRQIGELDYEEFHTLFYCLYAYDGEGLTSALLVTVAVQDVNDNSPQWVGLPYRVHLPECSQQQQPPVWTTSAELRSFLRANGLAYDVPLRFICQLVAVDADSKENAMLTFKVVTKKEDEQTSYKAVIHGDNVYVTGHLDYETTPKFSIAVEAVDGGGLTNVTNVDVTLGDCNDNTPEITVTPLSPLSTENISDSNYYEHVDILITEEEEGEIKLATVTVSDADEGENAAVSCDVEWNSAVGTNPFSLLPLKSPTVDIKVPAVFMLLKRGAFKLDREITPKVQVSIICADRGQPQANTARLTVDVGVLDINDNAPTFGNRHEVGVAENEPDGTLVDYIRASDSDFGRNAAIKYFIRECQHNGSNLPFAIDESTGRISTLHPLDRENQASYCVTVIAVDEGEPQLTSFVNINIAVLDVNDSPPVFQGNRNESGRIIFEIPESFDQERLSERYVGQINATDEDSGENGTLEFSLKQAQDVFWRGTSKAHFRISRNGRLQVDGVLDREKQHEHELTVVVSDTGPSYHRLTSEIGVTVRLLDQNDNIPVFTKPPEFSRGPHLGATTLNISLDLPVNSSLLRICAKDNDLKENSKFNFTLRCAKYLRPYFAFGSVEDVDATEKCANLIVLKSLTEHFRVDDIKLTATPMEHQIYVTVMDLGFHQSSKTARIRLFIRENSTSGTQMGTDRPPERGERRGPVERREWPQRIGDEASDQQVANQVLSPNKTLRVKMTVGYTTFLTHAKAKYLFTAAVVILIMFIAVLGLLAFLFVRDFSSKKQRAHPVSAAYSACQAIPVVYAENHLEKGISRGQIHPLAQLDAVGAEQSPVPPHPVLQTMSANAPRMVNGSRQGFHPRECKPSESGFNLSESEETSIPATDNPGSQTQMISPHTTGNRMFHSPPVGHASGPISKFGAPSVYLPPQTQKAILLKDVSPCQLRTVVMSKSAEHQDYGILLKSMALSEVNATYTTLNRPTERKVVVSRALDLSQI